MQARLFMSESIWDIDTLKPGLLKFGNGINNFIPHFSGHIIDPVPVKWWWRTWENQLISKHRKAQQSTNCVINSLVCCAHAPINLSLVHLGDLSIQEHFLEWKEFNFDGLLYILNRILLGCIDYKPALVWMMVWLQIGHNIWQHYLYRRWPNSSVYKMCQ